MADLATPMPQSVSIDAGSISIEPIGVFCGAEVTGIDITRPLGDDLVEMITAAHAEHGEHRPQREVHADQKLLLRMKRDAFRSQGSVSRR